MSQTEETIHQILPCCPLCESHDIHFWLIGKDLLLSTSQEEFRYMICRSCNLYFQIDRPVEGQIKHWYEGNYEPYGRSVRKDSVGGPKKALALLHRKVAKYAQRVSGGSGVSRAIQSLYARQIDEAATLLDFGCGSGAFLDHARKKYRCNTIGMDFAEDVLAEVGLRGHRVITESDGGLAAIADGSIDLIRLSQVIEHLYDPAGVTATLCAKLKPGGMIHFATPDPEGPSADKFGEKWFGLEAPRHIMLFTPERLRFLAIEAGFSSTRVILQPTVRDWMRSLQRSRNMGDLWEGSVSVADILASIEPARRALRSGHADRYSLFAWK